MIEQIDNGIQIAVLVICMIAAIFKAARFLSRSWTLLAFFYGSWMLGDIYWTICLLFYDKTPEISVVSDLSWYASFLFLYLFFRHISPPEKLTGKRIIPWLGPVFTLGMALFFMRRGETLSNLIYAGFMGLLLYAVICRLLQRRDLYLSVLILVLCLLEYALWTASCFWDDQILLHPYYWFDFLVTVSFPFFLPAVRKKVAA